MIELQRSGDSRAISGALAYDPNTDGNHLIAFLSFLNRNGIQFAPAPRGKENSYHRLFVMMRALYLTVEDHDASTRPEAIHERIQ